MAILCLVRHGESEWNALELWTGWTDVSLTEKGRRQARTAGEIIKGKSWDVGYVSSLKRAKETMDLLKEEIGKADLPVFSDRALDERDYGNFTGMNKFEIENRYGHEVFEKWHRGWDFPLPHGETLKDVFGRTVPYFEREILPRLVKGENVIVSAHGNSLRALTKFLENISDEDVMQVELGLGEVVYYYFEGEQPVKKEIVRANGVVTEVVL